MFQLQMHGKRFQAYAWMYPHKLNLHRYRHVPTQEAIRPEKVGMYHIWFGNVTAQKNEVAKSRKELAV